MADCLRKLVTIRSFSLLQERLDRWNQTYKHNSYDENLANACELIELNARVQSQLFKLLSLCAAEGDLLGAHPATIRARLQPLLGPDFFESAAADQADDEDDDVPAGCLSADAALSVIANAGAARSHQQPACGAPGRRFVDVDEVKIPGAELDELEHDLRLMRRANDGIRAQLVQARTELERQARVSAGEKMLADNEIRELTARALSDTVDRHLAQRGPPGPQSPLSLSHPWQQSRQQHLIARFNEAFTASRAEAMEALRCCYDDHENNQRIVYAAVVESFNSAKVAFRSFKARVRSHLIARRVGPDLLEEAVQDFINCHTDLYDLHTLVQEVLRCLSRNSRLYLPPGIGYDVIAPFVTECCRIAWEMTALAHPLDVAVGYDGELFDDYRYRRSYDSEFSATGVSHHIWPALMQGSGLLMKGEACTRRGHPGVGAATAG
uniref:Mitochondria-eating protein n=2 Tax=Macrostomum lignano TaxID=282301 RepID=A0A1I8IDM0_9PLAT